MASKSAVGPIRRFDASQFPVRFAAQCIDQGLPVAKARWCQELRGRLTRAACLEALAQSKLPGERVGVCLGSEASRPPLALVAHRLRDQELPAKRRDSTNGARCADPLGSGDL